MHIQTSFCLPHLQFALLVQVQDAFFKVVHLAEDQRLIEHGVVAPQQRNSFSLQDSFSLPNICIKNSIGVQTTANCVTHLLYRDSWLCVFWTDLRILFVRPVLQSELQQCVVHTLGRTGLHLNHVLQEGFQLPRIVGKDRDKFLGICLESKTNTDTHFQVIFIFRTTELFQRTLCRLTLLIRPLSRLSFSALSLLGW